MNRTQQIFNKTGGLSSFNDSAIEAALEVGDLLNSVHLSPKHTKRKQYQHQVREELLKTNQFNTIQENVNAKKNTKFSQPSKEPTAQKQFRPQLSPIRHAYKVQTKKHNEDRSVIKSSDEFFNGTFSGKAQYISTALKERDSI